MGIKIRNRGHLPHWETDEGIYFVTFRLADSLPQSVVASLKRKSRFTHPHSQKSREVEEHLDAGIGACHLRIPAIARTIKATLERFDELRYRLFAWCIMPNHVHVVLQPKGSHKLAEILHSWKSYSAQHANKILHQQGAFWQREYYDHLIRDGAQLRRAIRYTAENPLKARLTDWPWSYVSKDWS